MSLFKSASLLIFILILSACGGGGGSSGGGGSNSSDGATPDTTPNAFSFIDQSDVDLLTEIESNTITVSGIDSATAISITGGEYAINGGSYTSAAGIVTNGQQVVVRQISADSFSTQTDTVLSIGGVNDSFSVTTLAEDTSPDSFAFDDQINVNLSTEVTSNTIIVSGINSLIPISVNAGEYSVDGGVFTNLAGTVEEGQSVQVRQISSDNFSTTTVVELMIGDASEFFSVTTLAEDSVPEVFIFADVTNVPPLSQQISNSITVSGINTAVTISITGGEYSIDGNPFTATNGVVSNGESIVVRQTSSPSFSTTTSAALTIGSVSDSFDVSTQAGPALDTTPDPFAFVDQTDVPLSELIVSAPVLITGINSPASISVLNGEYAVGGGAFTTNPGIIGNNQQVLVRQTSSPDFLTITQTTLTVGGVSDSFSSTTRAADVTPDEFAFVDISDAPLSELQQSNSITITGIEADTNISIANGEYSINGASFTSAPGTVDPGSPVVVQQTSSPNFSTQTNATLTIGGVSDTFSVTTLDQDTAPDLFTFIDQFVIEPNTVVLSNTITITGVNSPTAISVSGGEYSIDGGSFTEFTGSVEANQTVQLRQTASSNFDSTTNTILTVGTITDTFSVTTRTGDATPDSFTFFDQVDVNLSTAIDSNSVLISSIEVAVPISIIGGEYSIDGGPFLSTPSVINNDQLVKVRLLSSPNFATRTDAILSVGGVSDTFSVTTRNGDTTPDPFLFSDQVDVPIFTLVESDPITITGIEAPALVTIAGGEFSIEGAGYTNGQRFINSNQSVVVRVRSSINYATTVAATLFVDSVSATFSATSEAEDLTPENLTFSEQTGVERDVQVLSEIITLDTINNTAPLSVSGGSYSLNGQGFQPTNNIVTPGDTIQLRLQSAATLDSQTTMQVTVGTVTTEFSVVTRSPNETVPPVANIDFPSVQSLTEFDSVLVRGTASDASGLTAVQVNGVLASTADSFQNWHARVPLNDGDNLLSLVAIDNEENQFSTSASIRRSVFHQQNSVTDISSDGNTVYIFSENQLFSVDRLTGLVDLISGLGFPNNDNRFFNVTDIALDEVNNRILVIDEQGFRSTLKEVDVATGQRNIIFQDANDDPLTPVFNYASRFINHPSNSQEILLLDLDQSIALGEVLFNKRVRSAVDSIYAVNVTNGQRTLVSGPSRGTGLPIRDARSLITHPQNNSSVIVANGGPSFPIGELAETGSDLLEVDLISGNRSRLSGQDVGAGDAFDHVIDLLPHPGNPDQLVVLNTNDDNDFFLYIVDIADGDRTLISNSNDAGNGDFVTVPKQLLMHPTQSDVIRVLASNGDTETVFDVNLDDGIVSTVLEIDEGFSAVIHPQDANKIVVPNPGQGFIVYDLSDNSQQQIGIDSALTLSRSTNVTGEPFIGINPVDTNSVLVALKDFGNIYSVNLINGTVSEVSLNGFDQLKTFGRLDKMQFDEAGNRLFLVDNQLRAYIEYNLDTGTRDIIGQFSVSVDEFLWDERTNRILAEETIFVPIRVFRSPNGFVPGGFDTTTIFSLVDLLNQRVVNESTIPTSSRVLGPISGIFPAPTVNTFYTVEQFSNVYRQYLFDLSDLNNISDILIANVDKDSAFGYQGSVYSESDDEILSVNAERELLLVFEGASGVVREEVFNNTPDQSNLFNTPLALTNDLNSSELLLADDKGVIFSIDKSNGERTIIGDNCEGGFSLQDTVELLTRVGDSNSIYALGATSIININKISGLCESVSDAANGTPLFVDPTGIINHPSDSNTFLVLDRGLNAIVSVDVGTGDRSILVDGSSGVGPGFANSINLIQHPGDTNSVIVLKNTGMTSAGTEIIQVNLTSGIRDIIAETTRFPTSIASHPTDDNLVLVTLSNNSVSFFQAVEAVNLTTGEFGRITTPNGLSRGVYRSVHGMSTEAGSPLIWLIDNRTNSVHLEDLGSGDRVFLSR